MKFKGRYNEKHREVEMLLSVQINLVAPQKIKQSEIEGWFKQHIELLGDSVRLNAHPMCEVEVKVGEPGIAYKTALEEIYRKLNPIRQDYICNDICNLVAQALGDPYKVIVYER